DATVVDAKGQERLRDARNQEMIIGNHTRDADHRDAPNGSAGPRVRGAVHERHRGRRGGDQERTSYVDVTVWRALAEATGELKRGDPVFVIGRLSNDSWTDKEGNRRFTTRIEGQRVEFLTRGPGSGGAGTRPQQRAEVAQAS